MVAYSFKARFAEPILAGTKCQTIRADRKRHARPGEELQLYTGMRTRHCKLIGRTTALAIRDVRIVFVTTGRGLDISSVLVSNGGLWDSIRMSRDAFARADGFADWSDMREFWAKEHPGENEFTGVLISWAPIAQEPA